MSRRRPPAPRPHRLILLLVLALWRPAGWAKPEDWAQAIDAFTAADTVRPPPADGVVFVGSSSIALWPALAGDFPGQTVIVRGFGGSELADSVHYADRIVLAYRPRAVVLYAGDNDIANGRSPEAVAADFSAFCSTLHSAQPDIRIYYLAIKPSPARARFLVESARANALIAAACARDSRLTFVDVFHPMLDAAGQPRPELFLEDRLHLNRRGYDLWVRVLAPLLPEAAAAP